MGLLNFSFNSGPPDQSKQRTQFLAEAFSLNPDDQTYGKLLELANKYGAPDPVGAAEDFYAKKKEHLNLQKLDREQRLQNEQEQNLIRLTTGSTSMQLPPDLGIVNKEPPILGRYDLSTPAPPPQLSDVTGLGPQADTAQIDQYLASLTPEEMDALHGQLFPQGPRSLDLNIKNPIRGLSQTTIPPPLTKLGIPESLLPIIQNEFLLHGTSPTFDKIITQKTAGPPKTEAEFALAAARGDPQKALEILQGRKIQDIGTDRNALVGELYPGKTWADLSGKERANVNQENEKRLKIRLESRADAFGNIREFAVLDTANGNMPVYLSSNEINVAKVNEPGRYIAAGVGVSALNKTALIEDIRGSIQNTRDALNGLTTDFTKGFKAKIAFALRDKDPKSAISSLINSAAAGELTGDQQDYLVAITQLHEQALAMRSVLGAGQGSEQLRDAVLRTVPGATTPTKEYGLKQLDAFEQTLNRLARGIPTVPLNKLQKNQDDIPLDQFLQQLQKEKLSRQKKGKVK